MISPTSPRESPDVLVTNDKLSTTRADIECSDETVWHVPFSLEPSLANANYFGPVLIVYVQEPPLKAKKLRHLAELGIYFCLNICLFHTLCFREA